MTHLKCELIEATSIDDAHFKLIRRVFQSGRIYVIDRGSYEGHKRLEFDHVTFHMKFPGTRPLAPTMSTGLPPVTDDKTIEEYFVKYLFSPEVEENEIYCYSDDTEVLSENGWTLFEGLPKTTKVATLSLRTNRLLYQLPSEHFKRPYKGSMFRVRGRFVDQCVTPGHKLVVAEENSNEFSLIPVEEVTLQRRIRLKRDANWKGKERKFFFLPEVEYGNTRYRGWGGRKRLPMDLWLAFFGAWLADGSLRHKQYTVVVTKRKDEGRKKFLRMFGRLFTKVSDDGKNVLIHNKQLCTYLEQFGLAGSRYVPRELLELSTRQLGILFSWMYRCDGNVKDAKRCGGYVRYSTKSKQLADDVQELCLKLGLAANVSQSSGIWRVTLSPTGVHNKPHIRAKTNIEQVNYQGNVWCVRVPKHHTLYVRRNGKACWSGNTYGQYISPQIEPVVAMLRDQGAGTNQATMAIGGPESILQKHPPCLRFIDCRVMHGALHFVVYFRSWDLWAGLPENLGGLQLLKEYMANLIGVEDGEMIASSKGLHLYDYQWPLALARLQNTMPENSSISREEAELGEGWMPNE